MPSLSIPGVVHIALHFAVPAVVAWWFFRDRWLRAAGAMIATLLVDLDHLLATPIYDPHRCSIGFHPLHTLPVIVIYLLLIWPKSTRLIGLGLGIHMALDALDCGVMHWS